MLCRRLSGSLAKLTRQRLAMYPEYETTTRKLAKYFGVREEELLVTNGGDEALRLFFDAFVDAGTGVLLSASRRFRCTAIMRKSGARGLDVAQIWPGNGISDG